MTSTESSIQTTENTSIEMTSMAARQLHSSQKEALKKITEFSGESNEFDIEEWLFDLNNLFSLMKLTDGTRILEAMGKLSGPALRWYQENLISFNNWENAEQALRDRFKVFTSNSQLLQELFQIQQEENQSVTSFYENVIRKYRKAKKFITEQQVITVLQSGVNNSLKEYLIRNENHITKLDEWLEMAKEEEYIQKRIQQQCKDSGSESTKQVFFQPTLSTATIQRKPIRPQSDNHHTRTVDYSNQVQRRPSYNNEYNRNHQKSNSQQKPTHTRQINSKEEKKPTDQCLICNRTNHPTMKCFYKKENGCFKCGQSTHRLRDCPKLHFFV